MIYHIYHDDIIISGKNHHIVANAGICIHKYNYLKVVRSSTERVCTTTSVGRYDIVGALLHMYLYINAYIPISAFNDSTTVGIKFPVNPLILIKKTMLDRVGWEL